MAPPPGAAETTSRSQSAWQLVGRLLHLAWIFRGSFLLSLGLSAAVLAFGLAGLQLLGTVIDVIRHALDPAAGPAPHYPFGWTPPPHWTALRTVTVLSLGIIVQAVASAGLAFGSSTATARL